MSKKTMTLEKFQSIWPYALMLQYVERGESGNRARGWHVALNANYFTSDTDRLVKHQERIEEGRFTTGWGATLEEALYDFASKELSTASMAVAGAREHLRSREGELADLRLKISGER